jgi:hypothetical protein
MGKNSCDLFCAKRLEKFRESGISERQEPSLYFLCNPHNTSGASSLPSSIGSIQAWPLTIYGNRGPGSSNSAVASETSDVFEVVITC